jgi:hypothetical protein
VSDPGDYERVPAGIMVSDKRLTEAEAADLRSLAETVSEGRLCSRLIGLFLAGLQEHTGFKPSVAARRVARQIGEWDDKGLHMSPGLVATILRSRADSLR